MKLISLDEPTGSGSEGGLADGGRNMLSVSGPRGIEIDGGIHEGAAMSEPMEQQVALARLAAAIERAAADLGLEEEPARFVVALEDGADQEAGA